MVGVGWAAAAMAGHAMRAEKAGGMGGRNVRRWRGDWEVERSAVGKAWEGKMGGCMVGARKGEKKGRSDLGA